MISTWAATTGAWEDSKFDRAWNGPFISPDEADLTLSTTAPTVGVAMSPGTKLGAALAIAAAPTTPVTTGP